MSAVAAVAESLPAISRRSTRSTRKPRGSGSRRAGCRARSRSCGREPKSEFVPAHWRWEDAKVGLDAAGRLIDVALAERRNLVMRNPAPGANFETTRTLVCAYQMILPGEMAPSHRHSSHALRVIIDGKGSFSTVNGEKMPMETGDVVLTPGWCWHGHGHDGDAAGLLVRRPRRAADASARADVLRGASGQARQGRAGGDDLAVPLHARGDRARPRRGEARPRGLPRPAHQIGGAGHAADGTGDGTARGRHEDPPLPLDRQHHLPGDRGRGRNRRSASGASRGGAAIPWWRRAGPGSSIAPPRTRRCSCSPTSR